MLTPGALRHSLCSKRIKRGFLCPPRRKQPIGVRSELPGVCRICSISLLLVAYPRVPGEIKRSNSGPDSNGIRHHSDLAWPAA